MSYTCLLMVLCANIIPKANFHLINRTDSFICLKIMIQISYQNSKGQKSYCKVLGVRSDLLLSIHWVKLALWNRLWLRLCQGLGLRLGN